MYQTKRMIRLSSNKVIMISLILILYALANQVISAQVILEQCLGVNGTEYIPAALIWNTNTRHQITQSPALSETFYTLYDAGNIDEALLLWNQYYDPTAEEEELWTTIMDDLRGIEEDEPERVDCLLMLAEYYGWTDSQLYSRTKQVVNERLTLNKRDQYTTKCYKSNLAWKQDCQHPKCWC
ncbi:hypothetical protein Kpol_526p4 [Vanderwaltozyma polyspora DSM 70294]|uniref:Uncharacterized protein n=1 Tax=Vanderwaltozyma polyspora (strain ATCC 22028 / DSM 70294 / BCRC 21397 / CBS 2163 / NBRC 10782 / NRRL Y-8283 / UCD 57-17) TaxID=436907 RepID=A7TLR0_VANPO|nr:uncharacterized protein Kpol_526p4 [Vanderwaltozyma polyspora DSM 70294]EDO16752.1 hypothetical protein Kpol_526p4 [Vanderwaltozyma polyspora DSM 70294]